MSRQAINILERALAEWKRGATSEACLIEGIEQALAALEAEGVGLPWVSIANQHPHPHDDVVLWSDFHGRWLWDRSWAELHRATHWLPLSAIPLPGQSGATTEAWVHPPHVRADVSNLNDVDGPDAPLTMTMRVGEWMELLGMTPAPSAGLREAVEDLLWRRNNEQFTDEEWPDKLIEALNADAAEEG